MSATERPLKIGITGANGFIGSELSTLFKAAGHTVVSFGRTSPPAGEHVPYELGDAPDIFVFDGLDIFVHGAYDFACTTLEKDREKNVSGSIAVLRKASEAGVPHVFFLSSLSSYDGCCSRYGQNKLAVERDTAVFRVVSLRLGLVYGSTGRGLSGTLKKVAEALPVIPLPGLGRQPLYPIHVEDLFEAIRALSTEKAGPPVIPLAHPNPVSFRDILLHFAAARGKRPLLAPFPWQSMWAGLRMLEAVGLKLGFRSDSLLGLCLPPPSPDFRFVRERELCTHRLVP